MKKLMFFISCLFSVVLALGFLFKVLHWPGSSELLISAIVLVFILTSLFAFDRYKVAIARTMSEKLTVIFGAAAVILYFLGAFAKIMHWPGAGTLVGLGTTAFIAAFPLLFFTIYKNSAFQ